MWILPIWLMITHHLQQQIINIDGLIDSLEKVSSSLFKWFKDNLFKGNLGKCHLLLNGYEKTKI